MKPLARALCVCLIVALARSDELEVKNDPEPVHHQDDAPDRCRGLEMDAVAVNEEGIPYFFKGDQVFKGFDGKAERANDSFAELGQHGCMDAAFRLHYEDHPTDHNNMFFFLNDSVFSYFQHKMDEGYPKKISEVFPGIPDQLDAAVECPKPECDEDSVIFFKGHDIFHYNVKTKAVDMKDFKSMPNCTSAFRFMEHYYCFHGHMFSKFDPKTGAVEGKYPKEARDYFMRCAKFSNDSNLLERERCSRVHLDAITSDNHGNMYAFRGDHFLQRNVNDTLQADTIKHAFKEVHGEVNAAFSFDDRLYMIKDQNVFIYKVGENHTHEEGSPKSLKEVLGMEGHIDATFSCENDTHVHVIKGDHIFDVDMSAAVREATNDRPISVFKKVNAAMCGPGGLKVVVGNYYYHFDSIMLFVGGRAMPKQHRVPLELFGCDH